MSGERVLAPDGRLIMRPDGRAMLAESGAESCCGEPGNCCVDVPEQPECGKMCITAQSQDQCEDLGGSWWENGCQDCTSLGACCAPSGDPECPLSLCRITSAADCAFAGGVWHGPCSEDCGPGGPCGVQTERVFGIAWDANNTQVWARHLCVVENTVSGCGKRTTERGENLLAANGLMREWCADAAGRPLEEIWTLLGGADGAPAKVEVQTTSGPVCFSIGPRQTVLHLSIACGSLVGRARWYVALRSNASRNCGGEQVFTYPGYSCSLCSQAGPNQIRSVPRSKWGTLLGDFCWGPTPPFPTAADRAAHSILRLGLIDLYFRLGGISPPSLPALTLSQLQTLMSTAPQRYAEVAVSSGLARWEFFGGSPFQHEFRYYKYADYSGPMGFLGSTLVSPVPSYTRRTQAWSRAGACAPADGSGTYYPLALQESPLGGLSAASASVFELPPASGC